MKLNLTQNMQIRIPFYALALIATAVVLPTPAAADGGKAGFQLVPQKGHTALITDVDFSADSRFILTGSLDKTARLWDARSNILVRVFRASASLRQAAFVPGDKRVVAHDDYGTLYVFDMVTGELLRTVSTARSRFPRLLPLKDGRRVLVSNENRDIRLVDVETGESQPLFDACPGDPYPRTNIDISPDNRLVITACVSGEVGVRELASGRVVATYRMPKKGDYGVTLLKDSRRALIVYSEGPEEARVQIWDFTSGTIQTDHRLGKRINGVALSPGHDKIAVLADVSLSIGAAEIRDLETFELEERFTDEVGNEKFIRISPDGRRLLAPGDTSSINLFDIASKKRVARLSSENSGGMRRMARRPDRWQVAAASGDGNVYLFDVASAALVQTFDAGIEHVTSVGYSPDGRYLATTDLTNPDNFVDRPSFGARLWDVKTGEQLRKKVMSKSLLRVSEFTPDGRFVVIGDRKVMRFKDPDSWKTRFTLPHDGDPYSISFAPHNDRVALSTDTLNDGIFDLRTGKRIAPFPRERVSTAYFLPDGRRILLSTDWGYLELWDMETQQNIRTFASNKVNPDHRLSSSVSLSRDGTRMAYISNSNTLDVWELETGTLLHSVPFPSDGGSAVTFLPNPSYVAVGDRSGAIYVVNVETEASMIMTAEAGEWIVYTQDGYFDGSRGAGKLVAVVKGLSSYRIDQLATKNNRPDIILSRMGLGSEAIIAHYRKLFQRRLAKLGLREADLENAFDQAPRAAIASVRKLGPEAAIEFDISDSASDLVRYNVYVNDVPIFGAEGKPVSGRRQTIRETFELASGDNKIEVSALNSRGVESLRPSVSIPHLEQVVGDLYYLGFGVSRYRDAALNLKYAAKDADDLADTLRRLKRSYGKVHAKVFTDDAVTREAIAGAKTFLADAKVDDTVVLFAAGHGVYVTGKAEGYYYLTHGTDLSRIPETAARFELLEGLLQGITPRKKLFLIDTCQSGEADGNIRAEAFEVAGARGLISRGLRRKVLDSSQIPRDQHLYAKRDRFIYNDLFRRSGAIVLSSSKGSELSFEKDDIKNGLFTEYVLRALSTRQADADRDGRVSTDELRTYVASSVSTATGGLQNPVVDRDNLEMRLAFPVRR